jgi:hypothetical protein
MYLLNRRHLLFAAGASTLLPATARAALAARPEDREEWHFDINRPDAASPVVRAHLQGRGRATLRLITGVSARLLHGAADAWTPDLVIAATRLGASVSMAPHTAQTIIRCAGDCQSLVTAWALPLLGSTGFTAFDSSDLKPLMKSLTARFYNLPLAGEVLSPKARAHAASASGAYAVFFGDGFSLYDVQSAVESLDRQLPQHANRIFATVKMAPHEPRCLLTLFE